MARKQKRGKTRKRQKTQLARGRQTPGSPAKTKKPAKISIAEEYRYVYSDLRRMGVLAAGMFVLMIVLAFVLQ